MAAPTITSRTPEPNATNVYINQLIYVVFDQNIDSDTLTDNTILLYRTSDYAILDKTIEYDSSTYTVTITPDVVFSDNTTYNMVIVGADQSATCVKNASSESLAVTSTWYFTSGTEVYEAPSDTAEETQEEQPVAPSPVTPVLEPRSSSILAITETDPEQYSTNLGDINNDYETVMWAGPISITFNAPMASGALVSQDWITLSSSAVDGDPSTSTHVPSGVVENVNGDTITWTPSTYDDNHYTWKVNNQIDVTISKNTQDASGNTLGSNYKFMFTTRYHPYYCSVSNIRTVIGPFVRQVNDDAIGRNIYLNSLEIYNIANTIYDQQNWDMASPTFAAKQWVCCKTQYDLLYAKLLDQAECGTGQMKRLGDFTIQDMQGIQEGIKGAIQRALDCMDAWFKLVLGKYRRAKAQGVVKGVSATSMPPIRGVRTWAVPSSSEGIGSNKRGERSLKSPGIYSNWS